MQGIFHWMEPKQALVRTTLARSPRFRAGIANCVWEVSGQRPRNAQPVGRSQQLEGWIRRQGQVKFKWLWSYSFLPQTHIISFKCETDSSLFTPSPRKRLWHFLCRTLKTSRWGELSSEVGYGRWVLTINKGCALRDAGRMCSLRWASEVFLCPEVSSVTTRRLSWASLLGDSGPWMPLRAFCLVPSPSAADTGWLVRIQNYYWLNTPLTGSYPTAGFLRCLHTTHTHTHTHTPPAPTHTPERESVFIRPKYNEDIVIIGKFVQFQMLFIVTITC